MAKDRTAAKLQAQYGRLAGKLAQVGWLLQGTISQRTIERVGEDGKTRSYGPYYQWTWKQAGKTVTVNLSASQRRAFQQAIDNQRRLEITLERMRVLSRRVLELTTEGVPRRTPRRKLNAKD